MEVPPAHICYRSIGFRRLRRIVNEAYLASFLSSRYPYVSQLDEDWKTGGLSFDDFGVSWKSALDEVVSSRQSLASFEPLRNVTEEEEERFLSTLSLERKGLVVTKRKGQSRPLPEKKADSATVIRLGKERLCRMDKSVSSFLTSNPAALPLVSEIESRILALYPMGEGCITLDSPLELFLAQGVAQFYGFQSQGRYFCIVSITYFYLLVF